jgi:hypothetical protein
MSSPGINLAGRLFSRLKRGQSITILHATAGDLGSFVSERSKCHENVERWCSQNRAHKPLRGWLVTSDAVFDRHSVVDRGPAAPLDITPLDGRPSRLFLAHDESDGQFESLSNQVNTPGL